MAIGFGRGLQQLHSDDLERRRQEDLTKKLMYQKELDRQLMEKRLLQRSRDPESRAPHAALPLVSLPLQQSMDERERQRRKQLEYKQTLEQQMKERQEQRRKEQELATGAHVEACEGPPAPAPVQPKETLQKHANQQKVQTILREQIFERKQREAEERRKREEQEAADEARIQREREELRLAYEREKAQLKMQRNKAKAQAYTATHGEPRVDSNLRKAALTSSQPTSESQSQLKTRERARRRASTVAASARGPPHRRSSLSVSISGRRATEHDPSSLLADLDAKRREMVAMREQQVLLEKQIEQQQSELERLSMLRATPERRKSVQVYSENHPYVDPWSGRRRNSFGSVESSSSTSAMPPRPPLRSTDNNDGPAWASHAYEPLRRHSDFEQSMLSQSKLIAQSGNGGSNYGDGTWSKPKISESPNLTQHKVLLQPVPETCAAQPRKDDTIDGLEDESIAERSLPLASRYFVFVEQKQKPSGFPKEQTSIPQGSPLKTPVVSEADDSRVGLSSQIDELEQSRVRTAQAARMALQRASAHSDDEEENVQQRALELSNSSEINDNSQQTASYFDSIETELELEESQTERSKALSSRQSVKKEKKKSVPTRQQHPQEEQFNAQNVAKPQAETPKGERYQVNTEKSGRFLVHTPSRKSLLQMESLSNGNSTQQHELYFGDSEDELNNVY